MNEYKFYFPLKRHIAKGINYLLSSFNSNGYDKILNILVFIFIFCILLIMNIKTPLTGDDYVYSFIYLTNKPINSIYDIIVSQQTHYHIWGGRSIVHAIAQLLLMIKPKFIADVLNSAAFVFLILCMQIHIKGNKSINNPALSFVLFAFIWLLQPTFAETCLWITGSANYLWGTLIILLFLLPYRLHTTSSKKNRFFIIFNSTAAFIGGFIAGWTNENAAAAMIISIVLFIYYFYRTQKKIPIWTYFGLIGAMIGYVIMVMAPGNFARAAGTSISPFLIAYRIFTDTSTFIKYLGILNLGIVILFILYKNFNKRKTMLICGIYAIATFSSIYVMIFSPSFPPRAWFSPIIFNIILFGIVFYNLNNQIKFITQIKLSVLVFSFIAFVFSFYNAYKDVEQIDSIWKKRLVEISNQREKGDQSIEFKEYQARTKFGLGDAKYALKYISQYYDIDFRLK